MTRAFSTQPVDLQLVSQIVDLASRAPSAGKTQGWHTLVITASDTDKFWDDTLAAEKRESFRWKQLLDAPVIALVFADPVSYVERYSENDKAHTGFGASADVWPTPYWTVDASFAAMTMLLAAEDAGLGALFFAVFHGEQQLRTRLCVPEAMQLIGAIALGWPLEKDEKNAGAGASAGRARRIADKIIHLNGW
ncbi:MAG: nitroreductase family protein [Actinobacteria bacterium]|nr:nitroreductase family protein [Actinomycetota bacterium]MSW48137.1 nitroreductase family protein [Actinomycetota bacterium]